MNYDPYTDFLREDERQARELACLPICSECEEPIQDEYFYEINGEYICLECMESHRVRTIDYTI